jgi:hypothetical protein
MATLTLTNQAALATDIKTKTGSLQTALDERAAVWFRLPVEKRREWIKGGKDPVISEAWKIYEYLRKYFREVDNG